MEVRKFSEAEAYKAPGHFNCTSLLLAGRGVGATENFWVGCSHFLPGGGAGPDKSPLEKVYVILNGNLTVRVGNQEKVAGPMDTVIIPGDVEREIRNEGNEVVTMMVVMPNAESQPNGQGGK